MVCFLFMIYPLPSSFSTGKSHFWLSPSNFIEPFTQSQVYPWMQYSKWFSKAASPLSPNQQAHLAGTKSHPKHHYTLPIPADSHNWHQSFSKAASCLARPNRHPQSAQTSLQSNTPWSLALHRPFNQLHWEQTQNTSMPIAFMVISNRRTYTATMRDIPGICSTQSLPQDWETNLIYLTDRNKAESWATWGDKGICSKWKNKTETQKKN